MFIIEGTIGAGKSTFLSLLQQRLSFINIALEPVAWRQGAEGQSLLTSFYEDPFRWAYTLETFAMACRVKEHLHATLQNNSYLFMERSIYSGHYVFSYNSYQQGYLSELEWYLYSQWFALWTQSCKPPLGFIYLHVDPEVAYERIKKRNRDGENKISLDYMHQLHNHHERFLINRTNIPDSLSSVPVLILDCNEEFEGNKEIFENYVNKIEGFIEPQSIHVGLKQAIL